MIHGSCATSSLATGGHGGYWDGNVTTLYPDYDDIEDLNFDGLPVDFHVDACTSISQDYDAIGGLCHSNIFAVPENANSVFCVMLYNMNSVSNCSSADVARAVVVEHGNVLELNAAIAFAGETVEKINLV